MERLPRRAPQATALRYALQDVALVVAIMAVTLIARSWLQPLWAQLGAADHAGLVQWNAPEWALVMFQGVFIPAFLAATNQYRLSSPTWKRATAPMASLLVIAAVLVTLKQDVPRSVLLLNHFLLALALPGLKMVQRARLTRQIRIEGRIRVVPVVQQGAIEGFDDAYRELVDPVVAGENLQANLDASVPEELLLQPGLAPEYKAQALAYAESHGLAAYTAFEGAAGQARQFGSVLAVEEHQPAMGRMSWYIKRGMDILGGLVGLVMFSPIMVAVAIATKIENPGEPAFYRGTRVGLKGHHFRMLKFTTMRPDAQEIEKTLEAENERDGPWFKLDSEDDPRLTRVGKFVRKYSLNEIPQFWNILVGHMSLVGPRPPTPAEVATYVEYDTRYFHCLDVKPGLTGLWQITAKNDPSFDRRIDLDEEYIHNWSIWLDIQILLKTIPSVLRDTE